MSYTYTCGCVRHDNDAWTLCAECDARIGTLGTCLGCGGALNEAWITSYLPGEEFCSRSCADIQAAWTIDDD